MSAKIKYALLAVLLVASLSIALVGGFTRVNAFQIHLFGTSMHTTTQLAAYCPAPPVEC